ncbi:GTPase IMAP family member 9 [Aulostomus maculatus]
MHYNSNYATACEASPSPPVDELRIVLLGRTGTGRSSSANTILGRPAFGVDVSPCSVTMQCQRQIGSIDGRRIAVIDTPGFFHTHLSPQEVMLEVGRCVALSSPGPHTFLVTLQPGRFTQEEMDTLEWLKAMFGSGATRFTMVLFTWGDQLKGKPMEDFLGESGELSQFVSSCHGGFHVFDNSGHDGSTESSQQVKELLEKIDRMVVDNGGNCYSDELFKEAESAIREVQERILGEREQKLLHVKAEDKEEQGGERRRKEEEEHRREEEEARKRAERLFWCELVTALGRGAAEGAGLKGKDVAKGKVVKKAAALATSPLSISSAAKVVGGAVREGTKVFYKHRKAILR